MWDKETQGLLLGAVYWGYMSSLIIASYFIYFFIVCGQHAGHVRLHHALSTGRLLVTLGRLRAPSGRWFVYGEWLWEGGGAGKGMGGDCSGGGRFLRRSGTV